MKPYWPRTLQLFPDHLHAQDAYAEHLLDVRAFGECAHPYGILELEVDEAALATGDVSVRKLEAICPSGLMVSTEETGPLRRAASTILAATATAATVFVAVPRLSQRGTNVSPDDGVARSARYKAAKKRPAGPWIHPQPEIVFGREPTDRFELLSIGRVQRVGSGLRFDRADLPTLLRIGAAPTLKRDLSKLIATLTKRRDELVAHRADHPIALDSVDAAELPTLQLHSIVLRYLPLLTELSVRRSAHPHELYEVLAAMNGALEVFGAQSLSAPYKHDEIAPVFRALLESIETAVERAARETAIVLPFAKAGDGTYRLTFKREQLLGKRPFLVASGADESFLREHVPGLLKMASPEGIAPLMSSALRGVAVAVDFEPPAVVPRRTDVVAYRINVRDPLWVDIEDRMQVQLYLHHAPPSLQFALYGVAKTV